MPEKVKKLIHDYEEGKINRREFILRAVAITGSFAAANALIQSFIPSLGYAAQVDPNDPALASGTVQFTGPAGTVFGYQSRPRAAGSYPGIIIVHANQGLDEHIQDVARRLAKEGFVALAPDYLSRNGGTAKFAEAGVGLPNIRELVPQEVIKGDSEAALAYLKTLKEMRANRIGMTGFCFGGEQAFYAATQVRGLSALVVFYGRSPKPLDLINQIEGPVLAHYGELDKGITSGVPETEAAMKKYGKSFEYKIYSGAQHAFYNDGNPERYHPEASKEAWTRTLAFFKKHLQD